MYKRQLLYFFNVSSIKPSPPITIIKLDFDKECVFIFFKTAFLILDDLEFLSETTKGLNISGALGQTRTGTPKRARILSPLCLPISPRGLLEFALLYLSFVLTQRIYLVQELSVSNWCLTAFQLSTY